MEVTTRGGEKTIDPPMPYLVEGDIRREDKVTEASRVFGDAPSKEAEVSQKVVFIPRPPLPFP